MNRLRSFLQGHRALLIIMLAALVLRLVMVFATPLFYAPDEVSHTLYVHVVATQHYFPLQSLQQPFSTNAGADEFFQPPLFYVIAAPVYAVFLPLGSAAVYAVRIINVLFALALILVIYRTVRRLFPDRPDVALVAAAFTALLPTFVANGSSVNNDVLAYLLIALATLQMTESLVRRELTWRRSAALTLLTALALYTKTSTLILLPCLAVMAISLWRLRSASWWRAALAGGAAVLLVAPWWLLRNYREYGSPLAAGINYQHWSGPSLIDKLYEVLRLGNSTFWATFGRVNELAPNGQPVFAWALLAVSVICLAVVVRRLLGRHYSPAQRAALVLYLVQLAGVWAAAVSFGVDAYQPQGRYMYPALLAIAVLLSLGLCELFRGQSRRVPMIAGAALFGYCTIAMVGAVQVFPAVRVAHIPAGGDVGLMTRDFDSWIGHRSYPFYR